MEQSVLLMSKNYDMECAMTQINSRSIKLLGEERMMFLFTLQRQVKRQLYQGNYYQR